MAPDFSKRIDKFMERKGLKLLALVLASITWLYIRETTSFEDVVGDIPVEVLLPEGWAIQERSVNTVEVTFRGSQPDIRALSKSQVRLQVDVRNRDIEQNMLVKLDPSKVSSPRAVRAMYVDPPEMVLTLDRETDKVVPVRVDVLGQPPEGFDLESMTVTPSTITVHGPEQRLAGVDYVRTVPIEMEGRIRSFQVNRALVAPGENWQARMDVDRVRVEFTIVERSVRRDFSDVPVKALRSPGSSRPIILTPALVDVSLRGRSDVMTNLTLRSIHAYIDTAMLTNDTAQEVAVDVPAPAGASVISITPPVVRVEFGEGP